MNHKNSAPTNAAQTIDRERIPAEDIETLTDFDRNKLPLSGSYSVRFTDRSIIVADRQRTGILGILKMDSLTVAGFKSTLKAIAFNNLRAPNTLSTYVKRIATTLRDCAITNFSPDSYPKIVEQATIETNHAFTSILNVWYRLGYPGIDAATIDVVNALKAPSSQGRSRITSDDATEGWYTTQEYEDLIDTYWLDYESGKVSLRDTTALLLVGQYGKRGIQLANLKVCDFMSCGETDGLSGKRIAFPGAKDKVVENWFRGSKFEVHPLGDDLWKLSMLQIDNTVSFHEKYFGRPLTEAERNELPFFQTTVRRLREKKIKTFKTGQSSAMFHLGPQGISTLLKRPRGTTVISHRTGEPVREFAYRMRYTRARQLARLGVPRTTLQYWLGHEGKTSVDHYYDDPAEDARLLDIEMQVILAPLAQAFYGTLRDEESDAVRGDDPSSRIELDGRYSVGTCGEHGFCSASVPIPCYRCAKFQPWVDAPHEEVLLRLIERQEEENNIHLPSKNRRILVPLQLDKDIAAVKLVIKLCDARKQELKSAADETKSYPSDSARSSNATNKPKTSE